MGVDSPKSTLETEDHVPKAEHIDPIKSCLIRDDLHVTAHLRSKGHLLNPALKEMDKSKAFPSVARQELATKQPLHRQENFHHQGAANKIYAQTSLEVRTEGAWSPSPFLRHGLVGGATSGTDTSSFLQERGETDVQVYQEDMLQGVVKHLNITLFSGQEWVFQQDPVLPQKVKTTHEWLHMNLLAY